ncbi:MAG: choice-of-anchor D domain-containing protein [Deltaproteobacteria bacterium]|nr:choice-of-anchor D domain-containing protein [Deltaproteobacteria bacterium]
MFSFRASLTTAILAAWAGSGCDCGEEGLVDTKATLEVTPLQLDFGKVARGDLKVLPLQVANGGLVALSITDFAISSTSAEFSFATETPRSLQPQQRTQVTVVYQPTDLGVDLGTIRIASDTGADPVTVTLRGEGVEAGVAITTEGEACSGEPSSISFGDVRPNTTVERHITVRASGTSPVTVLSAVNEPGTSSELSIDGSALPKILQPGEELVLTARYTPVDGGSDQGAFVITTDAPSTPSIRVPVCGAGVAPAVCARPVPLDLGPVPESQSASARMTIESCGLEPLDLTAIAIAAGAQHPSDAGFRLTRTATLPARLAPGQTVEVEVTFTASLPYGTKSGWLQVSSSAFGSPESFFPLTARTAQPCGLSVVPSQLVYFNVAAGTTQAKSALVANDGESDCSIGRLEVTNAGGGTEFRLAAPPATPFTIAAGASRTLDVEYGPTNTGPHTGELRVIEAAGGTSVVTLSGNPPIPEECVVDVTPTSLGFGVVAVGTMASLDVTVRSVGSETCRISRATLLNGNPAFTATRPGLGLIIPGGNGTVTVTFSPTMLGPESDVLEIQVDPVGGAAGGGTYRVGVFGSTGEGRLCVMPVDVRFGTVANGASAVRDVMITSCGSAPVTLRGVLMSSGSAPAFTLSQKPALPASLAPGAAAAPVLRVQYAPTTAGPHFGQVEVLSNDLTSPNTRVLLSGNWDEGCTKILQCSPLAIDFGDTDTERPKLIRVVCKNAGPNPVTISSVSISGGGGELTRLGGTTGTVPPGGVWTVDVSYDPVAAGLDNALLNIGSDACIGPSTIPISGNGVVVPLPMCQPPSTFQPVLEWEWAGSTVEPNLRNVWTTPLVANLTDDNGDGRIDENDVPEVIFVSYETNSITDVGRSEPGVLRVLSGDTGAERFSVTEPHFPDSAQLAVGDLDGDGSPEIVGFKWVQTPPGSGSGGLLGRYTQATLVALDRTGRLLWESEPTSWPSTVTWIAAGISLADLDSDGFAEIVVGREVFDHRGHLKWRGAGDGGYVAGGPQSIVADIDNDGRPEVIAGGTVYNGDGSIRWDVPDSGDGGGTAIGMLDPSDTYPQIALFTDQIRVLNHLGVELWHAFVPTSGPSTQLPTIADFDGDGDGDIAVADGTGVHVFRGTGGLMWSGVVSDNTCCPGISAFDFEGDGTYELVLNDFGSIYVYRGATGQLLYTAERPSQTNLEMPVVADVDNDGKAEIVVAIELAFGGGGLKVYSNVGDNWVQAPRIWNQQSFYVDNVTEAGVIPRVLPPMRGKSVFRGTTARCE